MKIYGIVMAGGGGTRFWPLSRKSMPKQLLNLSGKTAMVNESIDRLSNIVGSKNIFVVTNKEQTKKILQVTNGRVAKNHILSEPFSRNTAACIGYAAIKILKEYGDGIMIVTPSDAFIRDNKKFENVIRSAICAAEKSESLVTVGIMPTFPSTGYGYINYIPTNDTVKQVKKFVEKPDVDTALFYISDGNYLWNSGIFIWKASVIINSYKTLLPDIYDDLMKISNVFGTEHESDTLEKIYAGIRSVSVDYGIMEKSDNILVVPGEFGWHDVGSWDMMNVLHCEDNQGNVVVGNAINLETSGSVIYSSGKLIATIGISDLIVVETPDSVLVCPKNRAQDVKKIVDELKNQGLDKLL